MKTHIILPILFLIFGALSCGTDGPRSYTITVTNLGEGVASASQKTVRSGDVVTLTATPTQGTSFAFWNVVKGGVTLSSYTEPSATFVVLVDDVEIQAVFGDTMKLDVGVTINGTTWATRNVGVPGNFSASVNDEGLIYQFNRPLGWTVSIPIISYPTPASPWALEDADASKGWGENDPCPEGWRVPTVDELNALLDETKVKSYWGTTEPDEKEDPGFIRPSAVVEISIPGRTFMDVKSRATLFLPAQGYRDHTGVTRGRKGERGDGVAIGMYWSAGDGKTASAPCLYFGMGSMELFPEMKPERGATCIPVRCVKA